MKPGGGWGIPELLANRHSAWFEALSVPALAGKPFPPAFVRPELARALKIKKVFLTLRKVRFREAGNFKKSFASPAFNQVK